MAPDKSAPALIIGLSPAGLYLLRELSSLGIPVYGLSDRRESGSFSACLRGGGEKRFLLVRSEDELVDAVREIGRRHDSPPVLFPASDRFIEWISRRFGDLSGQARFPSVYEASRCGGFLDKHRFYRACEKTGVPYPRRAAVEERGWEEAAAAVSFPVLVKPGRLHEVTDIMAGRKVFECASPEELFSLAAGLPADRGGWLLQEIVRGPDDSIYCLGGVRLKDGRIAAALSGRKLRQFPAGYGTASALLLEEPPAELWDFTERLLAELEIDGLFEIEFKPDETDGLWKVFEINARSALWFEAARKAGIPLAAAAYLDLSGGKGDGGLIWDPGRAERTGKNARNGEPSGGPAAREPLPSVLWRSGLKDLARRIALRRSSASARRPQNRAAASSWSFFDPADPLPAAAEFFSYFGKALHRLGGRLFGRFFGRRGK